MAKGVKGSTPTGEEAIRRTSFNIPIKNLKKLKIIATIKEADMQDLVNACVQDIIDQYEKKNGEIPVK